MYYVFDNVRYIPNDLFLDRQVNKKIKKKTPAVIFTIHFVQSTTLFGSIIIARKMLFYTTVLGNVCLVRIVSYFVYWCRNKPRILF